MNAELKRRILSDSGIGVPFAQTKILNLNLEYAMTTRVIALDLDGTLLTPKKTLLPSSIEALARAREAGYQLIIVTGRHHVAIHPFYQALALDTPAICCNGTYLSVERLLQNNQVIPQMIDLAAKTSPVQPHKAALRRLLSIPNSPANCCIKSS